MPPEAAPRATSHEARCCSGPRLCGRLWFIAAAAACLGWRHALGDVVAVAPAVVVASGVAAAAIAMRTSQLRVAVCASLAGLICGATLPAAPPARTILTHAPPTRHPDALTQVLDGLDADPRALLGRRVEVRGRWLPPAARSPAAVYERIMACCAADAVDVGLEVFAKHPVGLHRGAAVVVSGVVGVRMVDGDVRYGLHDASVKMAM